MLTLDDIVKKSLMGAAAPQPAAPPPLPTDTGVQEDPAALLRALAPGQSTSEGQSTRTSLSFSIPADKGPRSEGPVIPSPAPAERVQDPRVKAYLEGKSATAPVETDAAALADADEQENRARLMLGVGRATSGALEALTGAKANTALLNSLDAQAGGAKERVLRNRALKIQDQDHARRMEHGDMQVVEGVQRIGERERAADKEHRAQQFDEQNLSDPQSGLSQMAQEFVSNEFPGLARFAQGRSYKEIAAMHPLLADAMQRDSRIAAAMMSAQSGVQKAGIAANATVKAAETRAEGKDGGKVLFTDYEQFDNRKMPDTDARQFRKVQSGAYRVRDAARRLAQLMDKVGDVEVIPNPIREEMVNLRMTIQNGLKDKEGMGALQKAEIDRLDQQIPDSTTFANKLKEVAGLTEYRAKLRNLADLTERELDSHARVMGLRRIPKGGAAPAPKAAAPAAQGEEMVTVSNGKETLQIPLSDVADAEKDGYKRVRP